MRPCLSRFDNSQRVDLAQPLVRIGDELLLVRADAILPTEAT